MLAKNIVLKVFALCFGFSVVFANCKPEPTGTISKQNVSHLVVYKAKRNLEIWNGNQLLRTWKICLGGEPIGPKTRQDDNKTPEGNYFLDYKKPNSDYYKAFHISYPNKRDVDNAKQKGVSAGGAVMLHGCGNPALALAQKTSVDWTLGCIALSDRQIDTLWVWIPKVPIPITINP